VKLAYADPPYVGQAKKHYENQPDYGGEVDHVALIRELQDEYDGWALSCHINSLRELWMLCPEARVGVWVKPFAFFKKGVRPSYAYEPVLFVSSRTDNERAKVYGGKAPFCRDWVSANVWGVTAAERVNPVKGKKRPDVCYWIFGLLGAHPSDEFTDFFPGSGGVGTAWLEWVQSGGLLVPKLAPGQVDPIDAAEILDRGDATGPEQEGVCLQIPVKEGA
jgi:hypothetical protein